MVGDFNIDLVCDTNVNYRLLLESFNLRNLVIEPTRITSTSSTLIDHVLCDIDIGVFAGVYTDPLTDHLPAFVVLQKELISNAKLIRPVPRTKITMITFVRN